MMLLKCHCQYLPNPRFLKVYVPYPLKKDVLVETYKSHRPKSKIWHLRTHEVVETFQCGILLHDLGKGGWILTHM